MIAEWSECYALLDAVTECYALLDVVRGLRVVRNSTALIRDEVATCVSKHSVQKTSAVAFMGKYSRYTLYQGILSI